MMKKNLRIVMMACLMILSGTAVAQKTILMPQQAFENLAAWLTANDYVATSSKKQYSKGYVVSYDYAVPARKAKPIETRSAERQRCGTPCHAIPRPSYTTD